MLAKNTETGQMAAIKIQDVSEATRPILEREARLHQSLHHPNIIGFLESWEDEDETFYMALEYADQGSLLGFINSHRQLSLLERLQLFLQICFGLGYLHQLNILHRDLKLENVLLVTNKLGQTEVKLADFGAAREAKAEAKMTMIGTPCFVSPELLKGEKYGVPNDIWGLGCLLYVCLIMKLPFQEKTMYQNIPLGKYEEIPAWVSGDVAEILRGMLTVDPRQRWGLERVISSVRAKIAQLDPEPPKASPKAAPQPDEKPSTQAPEKPQAHAEDGKIAKLETIAAGLGAAFLGALCKGTKAGKLLMLAGVGIAGWKAKQMRDENGKNEKEK